MTVDPDELREALTIYHREFFLPDLERIFDAHFAEVHRRFDRLEAILREARVELERWLDEREAS